MNAPRTIADGLSEAQKRALGRRPISQCVGAENCCLPQHENTALALWRRGLLIEPYSTVCTLTPLGLAVRAELEERKAHG
jgi:hypothetical protein